MIEPNIRFIECLYIHKYFNQYLIYLFSDIINNLFLIDLLFHDYNIYIKMLNSYRWIE